jgi:hypothetical protein
MQLVRTQQGGARIGREASRFLIDTVQVKTA